MKRKVLVLHGYGHNAYMMSRMFAQTIKECEKEIEFYFLDGPQVLLPIDLPHQLNTPVSIPSDSPWLSAPACSKPSLSPPHSDVPRGWFTILDDSSRSSIPGAQESIEFLKDILQQYRFEAIVGFSQGAGMAEWVAAMLEHPQFYPDFCVDGRPPHPPLKYIVSIAGFICRSPYDDWTRFPIRVEDPDDPALHINTPVLHVLGRSDIVVPRERTEIALFFHKNKRIEEHVGGHYVPRTPKWRRFFTEFFLKPFGSVASPTIRNRLGPLDNLPRKKVMSSGFRVGQTLPIRIYAEDDECSSDGPLTPESPTFFDFFHPSEFSFSHHNTPEKKVAKVFPQFY